MPPAGRVASGPNGVVDPEVAGIGATNQEMDMTRTLRCLPGLDFFRPAVGGA